MKNKRVAITGGAGFIGSNLAHELATDNAIIITDDLSSGRVENIAGLTGKENVTFIQGSILDLHLLEDAFKGVDFVETDATGIFNVGTGGNTTINRLAEVIIKIMGRDLQPIYQEPRAGDIRNSLADVSRARAIGYEPKYSLEDGLQETIRRFSGAS